MTTAPRSVNTAANDGDVGPLAEDLFTRPPEQGRSLALVVQHSGATILERYGIQPADAFQPEQVLTEESTLISWSMAKSITHALVGILVHDGRVDVRDRAPVPEWSSTPKEAITWLDLLEMRSGLRFVEDYVDGDVSHCIEMLFGDSGPSHGSYAAGLPLDHLPGSVWNYSSGTTNILTRLVGDLLEGGPGTSPESRTATMTAFLGERLFGPVGMDSAIPEFDGAGDLIGSSFVYATARDFARFGELYLHDGVTARGQGERILPVGWLDHARTHVATEVGTGVGYGRHWWLWPQFPGSVVAQGYEGQRIIVVPDRDVVVVHLGKTDASVGPALDVRLSAIVEAAVSA